MVILKNQTHEQLVCAFETWADQLNDFLADVDKYNTFFICNSIGGEARNFFLSLVIVSYILFEQTFCFLFLYDFQNSYNKASHTFFLQMPTFFSSVYHIFFIGIKDSSIELQNLSSGSFISPLQVVQHSRIRYTMKNLKEKNMLRQKET